MAKPTTQEMIKKLKENLSPPDIVFGVNDVVAADKLPIKEGPEHWAAITVTLKALVFPDAMVEVDGWTDEEPFLVTFADVDGEGLVARIGDPDKEVKETKPVRWDKPAMRARLGGGLHAVSVKATAFDGGIRDPWKTFFENLVANGARIIDSAALVLPGGGAATQTVSDLVGALTKTFKAYVLGPDQVDGDKVVLDLAAVFRRKKDAPAWTAWKFVRFDGQEPDDLSYLTLWEIRLLPTAADASRFLPPLKPGDSSLFGWPMRPERAGPDDAPSNGGTPSTPRRYSVVWADAELERELAGLGHEFELLGLTEGLLQLRRIAATGDGAVFDVPVASVKELRARDGGRAAGDLVRALVSNTRR